MNTLTRRSVLAGAGLGALALDGSAVPRAQAASLRKVIAGENAPIALFWPGLIAVKNGFYGAEGLQVELDYVGSVTASVQQLIGGSIDFCYTTCEVALQGIEKGADAVIIGSTAIKYPYAIMSAPDVKTAADLKGKKVSLPPPRQDIAIFFDRWLQEDGVRTQDVVHALRKALCDFARLDCVFRMLILFSAISAGISSCTDSVLASSGPACSARVCTQSYRMYIFLSLYRAKHLTNC